MQDYPSKIKDQDQFDLRLATTHIGQWGLDVRTGTALRYLRHDNVREIVEGPIKIAPENKIIETPPDAPTRLSPDAAITFSIAVHKFYAKSTEYGSLRSSNSAVDVTWNISDALEELFSNGKNETDHRQRGTAPAD